jgi:predicted HNH restriction endonuclease
MQENDQEFFAVKVEDLVLTTPVHLIPRLHTDNKGFGPKASHFGDKSAKRLLSDIIVRNPEQETDLMAVYNRYFDTDFEFSLPEEVVETGALYEGAKRRISVNAYERNPEARQKCIAHYGTSCVICSFSFAEVYGEVGNNFIHVHHLRELSDIGKEYEIDPIQDLRPVCPNCHAIIHKRKPAYSVKCQATIRNGH